DIHGGGSDLIFPHHENEIAQSEAANCCNYARVWMHSGMITSNHKKMSKSQGNFQTVRELSQRFPYDVLRFFLISGHYRMPMEFTDEVLTAAQQGLNRIQNCYRNLLHQLGGVDEAKAFEGEPIPSSELRDARNAFHDAMDDDFNTADAVTAIFELVKFINTQLGTQQPIRLLWDCKVKLEWMCDVLGISLSPKEEATTDNDAEIEALMEARQAARASKNFAESDRIRDELTSRGIIIEDTPQGPRWRKA
ncbi:MAG: class I tRNA ligase family protein, partial [Defluviitaleaceae bacterium]|nr:class I tRNA ligase family protein [Defluviitaleaceae bacterium]